MSYITWYFNHDKKHKKIVEKLKRDNFSKDQIIDYFEFGNMVANEPSFCPLYENNKKCHDIAYINCYMCACPFFRFTDEGILNEKGILVKSQCSIKSKRSALSVNQGVAHLNCSYCTVPHTRTFIKKNFDETWQEMMKDCVLSELDVHSNDKDVSE